MRISPAGRVISCGPARQEGYSLLELLVVLAILSVMGVIVAGYRPNHSQSRDLKLQTYQLEMDLRSARSNAIYAGEPVSFVVDVGQNAWRYGKEAPHAVPDGIRLTLYTGRKLLGAATTGAIEFFPNGQSSGGHITLEARNDRSEVDIDWLTGRIHKKVGTDAP